MVGKRITVNVTPLYEFILLLDLIIPEKPTKSYSEIAQVALKYVNSLSYSILC